MKTFPNDEKFSVSEPQLKSDLWKSVDYPLPTVLSGADEKRNMLMSISAESYPRILRVSSLSGKDCKRESRSLSLWFFILQKEYSNIALERRGCAGDWVFLEYDGENCSDFFREREPQSNRLLKRQNKRWRKLISVFKWTLVTRKYVRFNHANVKDAHIIHNIGDKHSVREIIPSGKNEKRSIDAGNNNIKKSRNNAYLVIYPLYKTKLITSHCDSSPKHNSTKVMA